MIDGGKGACQASSHLPELHGCPHACPGVVFEARMLARRCAPPPPRLVLPPQGGPGCSSLFGMLYINGPYFINDDLTLRINQGSWNRIYGMLFIEQPIGVGWSKVGASCGLSAALNALVWLHRGPCRPMTACRHPMNAITDHPSVWHAALHLCMQSLHPIPVRAVAAQLERAACTHTRNGWQAHALQQHQRSRG